MNEATLGFNWRHTDTLLLDMDGTLLDLAFDNYFWHELVPQALASHRQLSHDRAVQIVADNSHRVRGQLQWYCLDHWTEQLGLDVHALKHAHRHRIGFLPGVIQFLRRARDLGRRIIIATNAHPRTLEVKLRQTRLDLFVDEVVSSHAYGYPKETAQFWAMLHQQVRFDPARCCFFDDSHSILAAARKYAGLPTVAIRRPDSTAPRADVGSHDAIDGLGDLLTQML